MSDQQRHALFHGLLAAAAGAAGLTITWAIGALSNGTVSLPIQLSVATPLVIALLTYLGTVLKQATEQPAQSAQPPLPPAPPAG